MGQLCINLIDTLYWFVDFKSFYHFQNKMSDGKRLTKNVFNVAAWLALRLYRGKKTISANSSYVG